MANDERIIKYFDNDLSPEEKISFENDLEKSSELREEFEKYLRVIQKVEGSNNIKLNQSYLDSIIPGFREKLVRPKAISIKRHLSYAFGIMLVFVISLAILQNIFNDDLELNSIEVFTESLDENQKVELLESLNGSLEDYYLISENSAGIELTNLLLADMRINNDVAEAYDIGYTEFIDELSQSEAEKVYNEILNKNFSEEVSL